MITGTVIVAILLAIVLVTSQRFSTPLFPVGESVPKFFGVECDFTRQDDIADGGATDFTALTTGTIALLAENGGWARLSGAATTDVSGGQIQALGSHELAADKTLTFRARVRLGETTSANVAAQSALYLGLFPVDTSVIASLPTDYIGFKKIDGETSIKCIYRDNSGTEVASVSMGAIDATTARDFMIKVTGKSLAGDVYLEWFIDGVRVHSVEVAGLSTAIFYTATIAFISGDATGTKFCDVDYLGTRQAR